MITVSFEYGLGADGNTESCFVFNNREDARRFAHDAIDEICDKVGVDINVDNAIVRIWDCETNNELIKDTYCGEN